ncbi:outer membrane protein assembly factor BamB family protein [Actinacidiphila bryophytorum]|uniref:outer membrane protein assembly factor BamB family protein n=1 Tax=Actinacidiphila bryophytorum TaxID=1436133 RepID=UPI002176D426|nr:PQQ-binding-like beta-propeller repeat protein [Actinacidiphila bryophytorum]UWE11110.1 PQQ-binding-like beta-propeller repeat protein [Actinacidiphila bryophytorum]
MRHPRTTLLAVTAALLAALTAGGLPSAAAAPPAGPAPVGPRSLGVPLEDTLLIGGTAGTMADGHHVMWSASSGTPAVLNAVDPTTGAPLLSVPLTGASGAYGVEQAADGTVYAGTYGDGKLFRLAPGATSAEDLGVPIPGETYVWGIVVAPDGTVYGGTSPGGKVFSWNPQTRAFHDFGAMAAGETYVKSIAYADGKVYAGAYASWKITELDPATGAKRQLPAPPGMTDPTGRVVNDLRAYGHFLYAREGTFPGPLRVYDLATGAWTDTVDGAAGLDVTPPGPDGRVWFFRQYEAGSAELVGYDPQTHAVQRTGLMSYGRIVNTRGIGWAPVDADGYPGDSIVALGWRGLMFRYNPTTGQSSTVRTSVAGQPTQILALASGPKGQVYAGGFLQGGLATVSTADGSAQYQRFSQIESLLPTAQGLLIGAYPDARVYRYDPAQPWYSSEYSDEAPSGTENPVKLLDLHAHVQSRLQGLATTAGRIVTGSTPSGDTLGGTLSVLDARTGAVEKVLDNFVTDEGITSLTARNGVVYGTTTVAGGLSTTPTTQDRATVFAYDVATGRKLWEVNPSATAASINAITFDKRGRLWTVVDGDVLRLDPATGRTLHRLDTTAGSSGAAAAQLALGADGTTLYALVGGQHVVRVDTNSRKWRPLLDQPALRMVYNAGQLVFADDAELVSWKVG